MTTPATSTRGGRQQTFTREHIITALRRYADAYGEDFTASAFSPSTAKWRDEPEAIERYYAGDPVTGEPWPSLNSVKARFGGSFNAAREAAGLTPNRPGPSQRPRRKEGEHAPVRDVSHVGATRTVFVEKRDDETVKALARAEREAKRERARADRAEAKLESAKARVVRERVVDTEALDKARARAREARVAATRMASKLERAEATITSLRAERAELRAEVARRDRLLEAAQADVREVEVVREVVKRVEVVRERPAPEEAVVDAARADARAARAEARTAARRAEEAESSYMELAVAVKGAQRRLTPQEVQELRSSGPAGPAVLAAALKDLARARAGRGDVREALTKVASAALGWKDRA